MKVLMINGSPRKDGNTSIALEEMRKIFEAENVQVEIVRVGNQGCQRLHCLWTDAVSWENVFLDDVVMNWL